MRFRGYIALLVLLLTCPFSGQAGLSFAEKVDSLENILSRMRAAQTDAEVDIQNEYFMQLLERTISDPEAMEYSFAEMKTLGSLISPDKEFRIFNWNIERKDGSFRYFAYIVLPGRLKNKVIEITHNTGLIKGKSETEVYDHRKWYGALYYKIIPVEHRGNTVYTLLGWDGNGAFSNKRIIESMEIKGKRVRFGIPIFKTEKGVARRIILEHAQDITVALRYEKRKRDHMIVYDHLSPKAEQLEGMYEQYVPDGTYDAFSYDKKEELWILEPDFEAANPEELIERPYNDPNDPNNPNNIRQ